MITRFSTLYVGHIELEQCGLSGIPADDRRYPNRRLAETFDTAIALAQATDALGYDTSVAGRAPLPARGLRVHPEHPAARRRSRAPDAPREDRLRVQHRPDVASAAARRGLRDGGHPDGGRVVFGVGRGYHSREVETFGNPMLDGEANRALFEEQVEIILTAFREESFSHRGRHYTLPPDVPYRGYPLKEITLVPRPVHQPVEVWQPIVSGSARSLDFMARHGIKGVISSTAESVVERWLSDYREANRRHGRALALGEDVILGFRMSLDETQQRAVDRARPYFEEHAKFMAPLGMLRYSEEHVSAVAARQAQSPTAATLENGVSEPQLAVRAAGDVVAYLKSLEAKYPGLEHVMIAWALGTPRDLMIEQLTRFAKEVMPAFRRGG